MFSSPTIQWWRGVSLPQKCQLRWQAAIQSSIAETIYIMWWWSGWPNHTKSWYFKGWSWNRLRILLLRRGHEASTAWHKPSRSFSSKRDKGLIRTINLHTRWQNSSAHKLYASRSSFKGWQVVDCDSHIVWKETCFRARMNRSRHQSHPSSCNHTISQKYRQYLKVLSNRSISFCNTPGRSRWVFTKLLLDLLHHLKRTRSR